MIIQKIQPLYNKKQQLIKSHNIAKYARKVLLSFDKDG